MEKNPGTRRRGPTSTVRLATAVLCSMSAHAHISAPSPTEVLVSSQISDYELTVNLSRGSVLHLTFHSQKVDMAEIRVGDHAYVANLGSCKLKRPIHLDHMELLREDLRTDEDKQDAQTLLFDVGLESERQFGELPRVQLSWRDGRLVMALITRHTAQNSTFSFPLCEPDIQ